MNPETTKIIACATVIEEMLPFMPAGMSYEVLDFGLHLIPNNLKSKLQEAIDASCSDFETIMLGYGLCSMALVGLQARNCTLVTPKVDDCISIFLGSLQIYKEQAKKRRGPITLPKVGLKLPIHLSMSMTAWSSSTGKNGQTG
jgi:hypothetical protein